MLAEKKLSQASKDVWKLFLEWYGEAKLVPQLGALPSVAWQQAIDAASPNDRERALASVRVKHLEWPPTLLQFQALMKPHIAPTTSEQSTRSALSNYVLKNYGLTVSQLRLPWKWVLTGPAWKPEGCEVIGVIIPPDQDDPDRHPSLRINVSDMALGRAA